MKNLAQLRASHALEASKKEGLGRGKEGGDALSGFPILILSCGLLAALAFAAERKGSDSSEEEKLSREKRPQSGGTKPKHPGEFEIAQAITKHLRELKICEANNADDLVKELAQGSSAKLRRATAEAVAYLNYLKRFVM
jgi:CRISPR type III-B/RAMP module-associated protein Cmr5